MMIVKIARKIISMKRIGFLSLSVATVFFSLNFSGCSSRHSHKTLAFFLTGFHQPRVKKQQYPAMIPSIKPTQQV